MPLLHRADSPLSSGFGKWAPPLACGRGVWNNRRVAIEALRTHRPQDFEEARKALWKARPIWKRLVHENVLPFHGVDTSVFQIALVYDWGHNENIVRYLKSNPDASIPELVVVCLHPIRSAFSDLCLKLLQVAKGLQYLHFRDHPRRPERSE